MKFIMFSFFAFFALKAIAANQRAGSPEQPEPGMTTTSQTTEQILCSGFTDYEKDIRDFIETGHGSLGLGYGGSPPKDVEEILKAFFTHVAVFCQGEGFSHAEGGEEDLNLECILKQTVSAKNKYCVSS